MRRSRGRGKAKEGRGCEGWHIGDLGFEEEEGEEKGRGKGERKWKAEEEGRGGGIFYHQLNPTFSITLQSTVMFVIPRHVVLRSAVDLPLSVWYLTFYCSPRLQLAVVNKILMQAWLYNIPTRNP